ncbi:MAG: dTDP-4-dehydrorhamnose reductase [Coriobacteriaceae bacterium]|nr:dTDP-4-dehydrorhamnose reductase [Coriobacteriaceae bacterium]
MKILICGANGQLGSELQEVLTSGSADVGSIPACYEDAVVFAPSRSQLDITDEESVASSFAEGGFDLAINCAAMTDVDACEAEEEAAYAANAIGPQLLARAAARNGCRLVHISTDYVFAGDKSEPYTEDDQPDPLSAYGRTKLEGERLVAAELPESFVIRTQWVYGAVGKNFVKTIMRAAREKGELQVVDDQVGCPTYTNDLAYEILQIAADCGTGLYHCSGNGSCSWYEFACAIVEAAAIDCTVRPCTTAEFPRPAARPACCILDNKRLRETCGDGMRPWREALSAFIASGRVNW